MGNDNSIYNYAYGELKKQFEEILAANLSPEIFSSLKELATTQTGTAQFNSAFVLIPRKTGRSAFHIDKATLQKIQSARPGLHIGNWTIDRLARVWLLMNLDPSNKEKYFRTIENLFPAAEVNELIALYSSLPLLAYPEMWTGRCSEGIRNNIADVLSSIMCNNPYPSENLDEAAWNQLVLKAFFTDKPVEDITGLDKRANKKLALTLSDYAHERWAAHRPVNPQLWRCVGPFIDESIFADIQKIASSDNQSEREAAALASMQSNFADAKSSVPADLKNEIEIGALTWNILAKKIKDYVLQ